MFVMPEPPNIPKSEKIITFQEAVEDESGAIRSRYLWQQSIKTPGFVNIWAMAMVPSMDVPLNFAALNFEKNKAHYLETGELPEDY